MQANTEKQSINKNIVPKNNVIVMPEQWYNELTYTGNGGVAKTIDNFVTILENDKRYKDKIITNELSKQIELVENDERNVIQDEKVDNIKRYIEKDYKLYDVARFESALRIVADSHSYHPIKEYLESLKWDGVKRLDTAFADYLGAEPSDYNAMCMRVILFGAISRIYHPGIKFDYMFIIKGAQGLGKSTFFKIMCGNDKFYQDDIKDISSDKVIEKTNGKWFVEMGELQAMKKAEQNTLKSYITTTSETYRVPYAKYAQEYKRQFILIGTTNEPKFLMDDTGERRFPIVQVSEDMDRTKLKKDVFSEEAKEDIKQILAEAYQEYKDGKSFLVIPKEYQEQVNELQKLAKEEDHREGIIAEYLEDKDYCCAFEIWCEAFGHSKKDNYSRLESNKITGILSKMEGWRLYSGNKDHRKRITVYKNVSGDIQKHDYGSQVCYERYPTKEELKLQEMAKELEEKKKINVDNINKILGQNKEYDDYFGKIGD